MAGLRRSRRRRPRRALRVVAVLALALLGLLLVSTVADLLLERHEKATIAPYGERIDIAGGAVNVYRSGSTGPPLVLLSGLGTPAPALDYAPLIRELGDFSVIVVEGFGYGYSDLSAGERTNQNIGTDGRSGGPAAAGDRLAVDALGDGCGPRGGGRGPGARGARRGRVYG